MSLKDLHRLSLTGIITKSYSYELIDHFYPTVNELCTVYHEVKKFAHLNRKTFMKSIVLSLFAAISFNAAFGQGWSTVFTTTSAYFNTCSIASPSIVYAAGSGMGDSARVLKSVNGGLSFYHLDGSFIPSGQKPFSSAFTTADTGCLGGGPYGSSAPGSGFIYRTTNGGASWTAVVTGAPSPFWDIVFPSHLIGYAACGSSTSGSTGSIYKTTNGGVSWTSILTVPSTVLRMISMLNDSTGYVVGTDYTTLQAKFITIRNGIVFSNVNVPAYSYFNGVYFTSVDTGFALAYNYATSGGTDHIVKTTDGGLSWTVVYTGSTFDFNGDIKFINSNVGFAFGGSNVKTTDGGNTWTAFSPMPLGSGSYGRGDFKYDLGIIGGEQWIVRNGAITATPILENPSVTFQVYPNPASLEIQLVFNKRHENLTVAITDVTGRELKRMPFSGKDLSIELEHFNKGLYLLDVTTADGSKATTRLVIQ
jgi:photosystem II stability/assembly factor-like uncharacterized protein